MAANAAFVAATVGGLTSAIIGTQSWTGLDQKNGKTEQLSKPILGVGAAVAVAASAILGKLTRKGAEPTFPGLHSPVHSKVVLNQQGVSLIANSGNALKSRISLFGKGGLSGIIQLQAKKGIHLKAEGDNTTVESAKKVVIKGATGIEMRATRGSDVTVNGKTIKLG